jgi:hypothetical protein
MKDSFNSNEAPQKDSENDTKVIPPCPFKVGDKVRRFNNNSHNQPDGVVVEQIRWHSDHTCYYLTIDGEGGYDAVYYELVESAQSKEDKLKELKEAFSKGAIIEVKNYFKDEWREVSNPEWNPNLEYRVKPEEKTDLIKYRVALFSSLGAYETGYYVQTFQNENCKVDYWEKLPNFVRWLTDWVEVKV